MDIYIIYILLVHIYVCVCVCVCVCVYYINNTKTGKVEIILDLSNHNLSKELILPMTEIAEAINYKWQSRKQIQIEESYNFNINTLDNLE